MQLVTERVFCHILTSKMKEAAMSDATPTQLNLTVGQVQISAMGSEAYCSEVLSTFAAAVLKGIETLPSPAAFVAGGNSTPKPKSGEADTPVQSAVAPDEAPDLPTFMASLGEKTAQGQATAL